MTWEMELGQWCCLQATSTKIELSEPQVSNIEGREVCYSLNLTGNLLPDTLPSPKITLTLGNSSIS